MKRTLLLLAAFASFIVSCSKNDTPPETQPETNAISGNYDLVGLRAGGGVTWTRPVEQIVTINRYNYAMHLSGGTATIDVNKIAAKDWTYHIDTLMYNKTYTKGVLTDVSEEPISKDVRAGNSTITYKLVGTDSVFFDKGIVGIAGDPLMPVAMGGKITWAGDTLIMRATADTTYTMEKSGIQYQMQSICNMELKLKKRS
ncbi:hypothetical protein F0L74_10800 [Chitinophaga agrisoli]|uniref:Lipocalin-like protein n=1 Tax=Chitinophaga agrisoli TaxID=2607653 RepID=A0A5B2VUT3_9BACT|nr:hypothetical protein [Chitinophaga agrisoli]KAA2243001.1 hypothetical protein F0L74_10800 [Chitinophaga agrisoli]